MTQWGQAPQGSHQQGPAAASMYWDSDAPGRPRTELHGKETESHLQGQSVLKVEYNFVKLSSRYIRSYTECNSLFTKALEVCRRSGWRGRESRGVCLHRGLRNSEA